MIELVLAPATETLQKKLDTAGEAGSYDFAFIDADREVSFEDLKLRLVFTVSSLFEISPVLHLNASDM